MDNTVHGILLVRLLEWVTFSPPGDLPNPGIKPISPALQEDSLLAQSQGKPILFKGNPGFFFLHKKLMNADDTKQTNKNQITHHMFTIAYVFASHILIGTFNK